MIAINADAHPIVGIVVGMNIHTMTRQCFCRQVAKAAEDAVNDDFGEFAVAVCEPACPGENGARFQGVHTCPCGV